MMSPKFQADQKNMPQASCMWAKTIGCTVPGGSNQLGFMDYKSGHWKLCHCDSGKYFSTGACREGFRVVENREADNQADEAAKKMEDCSNAYCNAYPDLQKAFCGGQQCTSAATAAKCKSHWMSHGIKEGRTKPCQ